MRPLCYKASVENPGEGTSIVASREENPQIRMMLKTWSSVLIKRDRIAFMFYNFETRRDSKKLGERNNSRSNSLRRATNLRSVRGNKGHVIAMSLVWSEFIFSRDPVKEFVDFAT